MLVKAQRSFYGVEGNVRRGTILDVDDYRAAQLRKRGLISEVKAHAGTAAEDPFAGGPTGAASPPSSSPPAPPPPKRTSRKSGAARGS